MKTMAVIPFVFLFCLASGGAAAQVGKAPNIVLIVSDDQGYHDLGACGNADIKTPHLDRIAREGVRLTHFYVTWPACTPSRGSLLTGRYPQRNGMCGMVRNEAPDHGHRYTPEEYRHTFERIGGMDVREVLLPALLKRAGYYSGIFGKWDLGMQRRFLPCQRGFDEFYGFVNTGIDYYTHERYGVPSMFRNNAPTEEDKGVYATTLFEREALRFLDEHAARRKGRPFFLYLPFNAPHGASNLDPAIRGAAQAPDEFKKLYPHLKDDLVPGKRYGREAQVPSRTKRKLEYLAAVTCMDAAIGKVLERLDRHGFADNTLVFFLSDNGGSGGASNAPLRGGKSRLFEGGVRVCALARWPGRLPENKVCNEFLTTLELVPTFCRAAGVLLRDLPEPVVLDGFDLMPVLKGQESSSRTMMFWEARGDRAARMDHWKWVDSRRGKGLFDLRNDAGEAKDLSASRPEVLRMVKARYDSWEKRMAAAEPRGPFKDF